VNPPLGGLTPARFLARYWQREPCLIRDALPGFDPLLEPDDLAGLACDPLAEARLIRGPDSTGAWELRHGPFADADFAELDDRNWTLLVQDVEKYYPPLASLMDRFDFLPGWRLDDLMVSFAATGGSVGAHVDQYDVFLLQASGRRRWEIAREFEPARDEASPVDQLANFEAEESWVLQPGDMLYLPPGIAHHGVALEPCMTYSVGLRAPSEADLAVALGEWLARRDEPTRYRDPPEAMTTRRRRGEVTPAELDGLRGVLRAALDDERSIEECLAAFLSRFRMAHEPAPDPGLPDAAALRAALERGAGVRRNPWSRLTWIQRGEHALLFAAGEPHRCSTDLAETLCGPLERTMAPATEGHPGDLRCLLDLLSGGHLLLVERN
jgi:50S ribosomal protein L16 3-hydroxylase